MSDCNCCCNSTPPWWVTMGYTPPASNTGTSGTTTGSVQGGSSNTLPPLPVGGFFARPFSADESTQELVDAVINPVGALLGLL
jgi:hypothetical protein